MRVSWLIAPTIALLTVMHNSSYHASGARGHKRALNVESEAESCADAIHLWMLADWQTNEGGAAWHATQGAHLRENYFYILNRSLT